MWERCNKAISLCWHCANSVPSDKHGCSWSEEFKPVEGWDAEETIITSQLKYYYKNNKLVVSRRSLGIKSYHVKSCPLFDEG